MTHILQEDPIGTLSSAIGRRLSVVTIGTRASKLALVQTEMVRAALLAAHPELEVGVERITTKGDVVIDRPLNMIGDKGVFITEIEDAMRAGRIDLAVHSCKDLPSELPSGMIISAFLRRADPRDVLISRDGRTLAELPQGATVGTSSLRRVCQLRHLRPDLHLSDIRGNVDTRLRKLREGNYDAIVIAAAGMERLDIAAQISEYLDPAVMLPMVAQGVIAVETRADDAATAALLTPLDDPATRTVVTAERAFLARIQGGCQVPVGAYAQLHGETLHITGLIGALDGRIVRAEWSGAATDAAVIGVALAEQLLANGGRELRDE